MEYYHNDKSKIIDGIKAKGVSVDYDITMQEIPEKIGEITEVDLQEKEIEITENGTTTVEPDEDHNGLTSVEITVNVPNPDYFKDTAFPAGNSSSSAVWGVSKVYQYIKALPDNMPVGTSLNSAFMKMSAMTKAPILDTQNVTDFKDCFAECTMLKEVPEYDMSSAIYTKGMFTSCFSLETLPALDISGVSGENGSHMFKSCSKLKTIPEIDTSNLTSLWSMFEGCQALETIPELDCGKVNTLNSMLYQCTILQNVGGFKDMGKNFATTLSQYDSNHELNFISTQITRESMLNVINKVYDIATRGVARQYITFKKAVQNQITDEEIAVATAKGWDVRFVN